jgi:NitT/TauT family transport system ATP-binding protein
MENYLEVDGVTISHSRDDRLVDAVRDISFQIARGEFVVLLGPSGCGKTTLLHAIGGLASARLGRIVCAGHEVSGPGPERVMVFQEFSLFRWRTVRSNVEFALECNHTAPSKFKQIVNDLLKQVGMEQHADVFPDRLSGGMKQRAAIARALAYDADVLLMDEPFGALDAQTRLNMQTLLLEIWERSKKTVVFVTHDIDEALYLADRILIMAASPGTIKADYRVTASRPRREDFLLSEEFVRLKRQIHDAIRAEDFRNRNTDVEKLDQKVSLAPHNL